MLRLIVEKNENPLVLRRGVLEAYSVGVDVLRKATWIRCVVVFCWVGY